MSNLKGNEMNAIEHQESLDYSSIYYTHNYEEENDENR